MDSTDLSEDLSEWEQIQSPNLPPPSPAPQSNQPIRDIFPQIHHEGLQISSPDAENQPSQQPNSDPSPPSSNASKSKLENEIGKCLSSRVFWAARRLRTCVVCGGGFWALASVVGAAAAVWWWVLKVRARKWRMKVREANKRGLILLLREKDEKISKLLLQIAQMNEVLSASRRVPVLRVG